MKISSLFQKERVVFCDETKREDVIDHLIQVADQKGLLGDAEGFKRDIFERESVISTGIGLGIAIPHAKINTIPEFFIVVGILKTPVEWDALDKEKVQTVFLIGGPDQQQKKYLEILSKIMLLIKNESRRQSLLTAKTSQEVVDLFKEF